MAISITYKIKCLSGGENSSNCDTYNNEQDLYSSRPTLVGLTQSSHEIFLSAASYLMIER